MGFAGGGLETRGQEHAVIGCGFRDGDPTAHTVEAIGQGPLRSGLRRWGGQLGHARWAPGSPGGRAPVDDVSGARCWTGLPWYPADARFGRGNDSEHSEVPEGRGGVRGALGVVYSGVDALSSAGW